MKLWPFSAKSMSIDELAKRLDGRSKNRASGAITAMTALSVTTVLACCDAIATSVAMPDLHVMRDLGEGKKEKATNETAYRLLHRRPNEFQTAYEFREQLTFHAVLCGMGIAIPTYDMNGRVSELIPVMPGSWIRDSPSRYTETYTISDEFGAIGKFNHDDLFIIRNRSYNRVEGLESVKLAAEAIRLSIAAEENVSLLQQNAGKPGGIIKAPTKLSPDAILRLRELWGRGTTGENAYKTRVLDNGLDYTNPVMTAIDQQVLENRKFQVEEICRAFMVFPQIVMHTAKTATFASAEAFFDGHNRLTAGKWQKIWCEKLDEFILDGAGPLYVVFDNRRMTAASVKDTGEYYSKALGSGNGYGWMTQNEVRGELGLEPVVSGDVLPVPQMRGKEPKQNEDDTDAT